MLLHIVVCELDALSIYQGRSLVLIICVVISILTGVSILTAASILMVYPSNGTDSGLHHDSGF